MTVEASTTHAPQASAGEIAVSPPKGGLAAAYTLAMLFLANMLNYADRSLLGIVVEPIRHELHLTDTQISLVSGFAFSLFYLIAGVGIARWVDRGNRRLILALGVALWSGATAATGLARGFGSLALCRMLIGVGEATVFPVALSMLSDLYPGPRLPRSVSIFQSSSTVGIMIGSVLAGLLAASLGWRSMFAIFGGAGVALVLLTGFMRPVPRSLTGDPRSSGVDPLLTAMRGVLNIPGVVWLALGYSSSNIMLAVLPIWAPAFLLRSHGIQLSQVGALVGPPAVLGGLTGTILSGLLATRLIRRSGKPWAGLIVPIVALPLAVPAFAVFLFASPLPAVIVGILVMNFVLSSAVGPCVALAVSLAPPSRRGLTSTVMLIFQTLIAFAIAPLLIGVISDALQPSLGEEALRYALAVALVAPLAASLLIWVGRSQISAIGLAASA